MAIEKICIQLSRLDPVGLIQGEISPRFTDISHYDRLENIEMRDNEMYKEFVLEKSRTIIKINDHIISPESLARNLIMSLPARHCYCLCLSEKGNDHELYKKFQADVCIEINIERLMEILSVVFSSHLKGMIVEAQEIKYYDPKAPPIVTTPKELVFFKPARFSHEAEFRIALFYPPNKPGFLKGDGRSIIPFMLPGESIHLTLTPITITDKSCIKSCIARVYRV